MDIIFEKGKISIVRFGENTKKPAEQCNILDGIVPRERSGGNTEGDNTMLLSRIEQLGAKGGRAYTVTFTDKILSTYREAYLEHEIRMLTKKTRGVIDYEYIGEYSKTGRFHLHGVVLVKDVKTLANLNRKYNKFGICKCKTIDNTQGWANYVLKGRTPKV